MDISVPSKYRGWLYVAAAVVSLLLSAAIALGYVTTGDIDRWVAATAYAVNAVSNILARLNLTPDSQ